MAYQQWTGTLPSHQQDKNQDQLMDEGGREVGVVDQGFQLCRLPRSGIMSLLGVSNGACLPLRCLGHLDIRRVS